MYSAERGSHRHASRRALTLFVLLWGAGPALAEVHTHGLGVLQIGIDGPALAVSFTAPAHDLVGFEHAPRNAVEAKALDEALTRLRRPDAVIATPPSAQCASIEVLRMDDGAAHAAHGDLVFDYRYRCAVPDALDALTVTAFASFPALARLRVQLLGADGAREFELGADEPRLPLR